MKTYSVQKPDDQDNGIYCGTRQECLDYLRRNYTPEEIDNDNRNAEYHGWQLAVIDDDDDYCFNVFAVTGDDIRKEGIVSKNYAKKVIREKISEEGLGENNQIRIDFTDLANEEEIIEAAAELGYSAEPATGAGCWWIFR